MHNSYITIILVLAFSIGVAQRGRAQPDSSASTSATDTNIAELYSLLARVGVHPAVVAQRASVSAAAHHISQVSSLPNPMLMLGAENLPTNSFSFSSEPMTSKMIGISQVVPFPGKLNAQAEAAAQDTVTMGTQLTEKENELARDIKIAYFEIYHLERSIGVNQFHVSTIEELLRSERQNVATGTATQAQLLEMELERSDMKTVVLEDRTKLAEETAALERASGEHIESIPLPGTLALPPMPYTLVELDTLAAHHRALLAGFRSKAEKESLEARRAELENYPDLEFSVQYMQRQPLTGASPMVQSDMVSAGVSLALPFNYGNERQEAISEDAALRTVSLQEERAEMLDIHTALESALAKLNGIRSEYDLLKNEIYPAVQMSLQTSNANYTYGKATIGDVLRDELMLMHREHDRYRLEAEYNETLAELEYLTGMDLVRYSTNNDWK